MTLYFIGIGLHDEKDISVRGLEAVRKCEVVYLEHYTSFLVCSREKMEQFYGKKIVLADRELVEKRAEETILLDAVQKNVAFLVVGDVFAATTHTDLFLRAKEKDIMVEVIHNASVISAVGITGLEVYKFGKISSIPFHHEGIRSPYDVFLANDAHGMHTLFLLDLDPKSSRFLAIGEAISYLLSFGFEKERLVVGCAGLGASSPEIKAGSAEKLQKTQFGVFPQCLIVPSKKLHFMEEDMLKFWKK